VLSFLQACRDDTNRAHWQHPKALWLIDAISAGPLRNWVSTLCIRTRYTHGAFRGDWFPVITDGEQRKYHNFWTYCVHGLANTTPDGFKIPFAAGHVRRMPRLSSGPFR
jgi:5-methyltetrahydropteroyltriglutamate--homocysteine methyltransferase